MYTISEETADEDLAKFWEGIIARLNEKTKWNLNAKSTASIDQILLKINAPKDTDPEKHAQTKKIWRSTMKCVDRLGVFVQRFGAFAAQAASVVFGPANQCFNAINFVITASQQYRDIFNNITVLMERVSIFLENLDSFMSKDAEVQLDRRLRKTVYRVLEHFLLIMSTTYDLTNSSWARTKLKAKSFSLGEDDGIKSYLGTMETLVSDFTGAQISVIVQDLSAAARDIRGVDKKLDVLGEASEKQIAVLEQLAAADASRLAQEREKKDRETIKKLLGIDESKSPWDRQIEIWESHVAGTGQWLKNKPYFVKWADAKATAAEVITLKAPSGFGKSHLASIVVRHLQDKHRGDSRVVVAYYYLQRESSDKSSILNKILKTLIWQVARANREYTKAAAGVCESGQTSIDTSRTAHLWKRLITDLAKSLDVTIFVVVDGIDEIDNDNDQPDLVDIIGQIKSILNDKLKVRLFITGTKEALDKISDSTELAIPEVNLEGNPQSEEPTMNQVDLELFVADRLDRAERLKALDDLTKGRITRELAQGARGAYSRLIYLLDDVVNIQNTNQIDDILQRANQSLQDIIQNKVDALNTSLSRDEIAEVNTLLDWLLVAYEDLNVLQCEAILSLKADGVSLGLEDRIKRKYSDIFSLNETKQITLRAGVQEYLEESGETSADQLEAAKRSQILAPEVILVRKVLQTHFRNVFGDEDVYSRFAFEDFFQNKLGDQAVRIRLIHAESVIKVAEGCLIVVCDKYNDERSTQLLSYAYNWFVEHLGLVNLDVVGPAVKQDLGRKLTRVLREPALIESWWATDRMYLTGYFVYGDYSMDTLLKPIHKWLKDPTVQKGLTDMPTELAWVRSVTADERPSYALYSSVGKMMARRFLETKGVAQLAAFTFLRGLLTAVGSTPVPSLPQDFANNWQMQGNTQEIEHWVSVSLVRNVVSWAKEQLGNADLVGRWHGVLASILWDYDHNDEAADEFRSAIELLPTDWELRMSLSEVLGEKKEYTDAVRTMEDLINQNQQLLSVDEEYTNTYWDRLLHDLGEWNFKLKDFTGAENHYQKILDHGMKKQDLEESTHKAIVRMLSVLNQQSRFNEAIGLLERLSDRKDTAGDEWIALLFREYCSDDEFHNHLTTAARRGSLLDQVSWQYRKCIEITPSNENGSTQTIRLMLRFYLAALLWTLGNSEQQESALNLWEEVIHHNIIDGYERNISWLRVHSARQLAPALLSRSRALGTLDSTYATRLEQLTRIDFGDSAQISKDPRLLLARMYHLCGDDGRAKETVRDLMRTALEQAEAAVNNDGLYYAAVVLSSLDDDTNALAAWSQYMPVYPEEADSSSDGDGDGDSDDESKGLESDTSRADHASDGHTVAGAEQGSTDTGESNNLSQEAKGVPVSGGTSDDDKPTLRGALGNSCDGACGTDWTYADDIYACKDCLDIQLNGECYTKLKAGELDVAICRPDHDYIHVPAFDEAAWRARPQGMVIVGDQQVPRLEWIQRIKTEWEIDEKSLKRSNNASQRIQRAWRAYKAFRGPVLKRSTTTL